MINIEKKHWDKYWSDPIPDPEKREITTKDVPWLLHIFGNNLSLGLTKKERKAAIPVRKWTKEKLREYCRRCMRLNSRITEILVLSTWHSLGQLDARRKKAGFTAFYREGVEPPELEPTIIPKEGDDIIYEKNGTTDGRCAVLKKTDKGWIGKKADGEIVHGTDLEVIELVIFDGWNK